LVVYCFPFCLKCFFCWGCFPQRCCASPFTLEFPSPPLLEHYITFPQQLSINQPHFSPYFLLICIFSLLLLFVALCPFPLSYPVTFFPPPVFVCALPLSTLPNNLSHGRRLLPAFFLLGLTHRPFLNYSETLSDSPPLNSNLLYFRLFPCSPPFLFFLDSYHVSPVSFCPDPSPPLPAN